MMNKDSYLVEAASGRWLRLPESFRKASCVIDLPGGIALNVSCKSGRIEIYVRAEDQIYRLKGELTLEKDAQSAHPAAKITHAHESRSFPGSPLKFAEAFR
jgi:hypothetical protein